MNQAGDVVVTGMGVVSPIGVGNDAFWKSLMDGVSGVRVRERFAETKLPLRIGAPVTDFDPKAFVKPRKALKIMCQPIQFGCAAAILAFDDAGYEKQTLEEVVCADRVLPPPKLPASSTAAPKTKTIITIVGESLPCGRSSPFGC